MIHVIIAVAVSAVLMFTLSALFLVRHERSQSSVDDLEDASLVTVRNDYVHGQMELEEFEQAVEKVLRGYEGLDLPRFEGMPRETQAEMARWVAERRYGAK